MYQHGRRVHRPRNYVILLVTVVFVGVIALLSLLVIHKDANRAAFLTTAAPIVSNVELAGKEAFTVDERLFTFNLPADWVPATKPEPGMNRWVWKSTKKGIDDRSLTIYVDTIPATMAVTRAVRLTANGDKLSFGAFSDACINFSGNSASNKNGSEPHPAKWENVSFICDPVSIKQTIGTTSSDGTNSTYVTGAAGGRHAYFFFFFDQNIRPDDSILRGVLDSFKAK